MSTANRLDALSRQFNPSLLAIRALADEARVMESQAERLTKENDQLKADRVDLMKFRYPLEEWYHGRITIDDLRRMVASLLERETANEHR